MPQLTTTPDWLTVSTLLVKILSMQDLLFADGLWWVAKEMTKE